MAWLKKKATLHKLDSIENVLKQVKENVCVFNIIKKAS